MAKQDGFWKKVSTQVTGGVILILIGTYLIPWVRDNVWIPFAKASGRFGAVVNSYFASTPAMPCWLIWVFVIFLTIVVWRYARLCRRLRKTTPLHMEDFREFIYEDLKWVWNYDFAGQPIQVTALCLDDSYQLDLTYDASPYDLQPITIFWCDVCKMEKRRINASHQQLVVRVKKEINRLRTTGEWEGIVRQGKATEDAGQP